ncbi:hypothetical protein [Caulobacter sp. 17J65-9]|uniref:hypothetical protein n=1 Tax=Caulobacter sp. 17J65-9 TaxID=2709382 RepID=UPI0013C66077|nr:hypothetical protein [Caulobacter sp. 17J65-9]NEX94702.1 hypothetical protein [Caulobacter sp. 17J65-9]
MSAGLHRRPDAIDNDLSIAAKNARADGAGWAKRWRGLQLGASEPSHSAGAPLGGFAACSPQRSARGEI